MKAKLILSILSAIITVNGAELTGEVVQTAYHSSYELEAQERFTEASQALDNVYNAYPNGYTVNYRKGWLAYQNGNYADARSLYQAALLQYPSSMEVRIGLILIEVARLEWKKVEQEARTGRAIDYYNLDLTYWEVVALRMQGNSADAITIIEEITTLYPTNTNFMIELAKCYFNLENYERAAELALGVLVLDPYNPEAIALYELIE